MIDVAANLQRLLARQGLSIGRLAENAGVDERTVRNILDGAVRRPRPTTLHKLARGLEAPVEELFQNEATLRRRTFDRRTNPVVDEAIDSHPELFDGWRQAEFDELYSRFGTGGQLTSEGALRAAEAMNRRRAVQRKLAVVLETDQGDLLSRIVEEFYRRVVVGEEFDEDSPSSVGGQPRAHR